MVSFLWALMIVAASGPNERAREATPKEGPGSSLEHFLYFPHLRDGEVDAIVGWIV